MRYFSVKDTLDVVQKIATWFVARRKAHQDHLNAIARVFGPFEELAGWYVEPDCQNVNPVDHDPTGVSDFVGFVARTSVLRTLDEFFDRAPRLDSDGTNHLFLLADAGMGKTSLLLELKLAEMAKLWVGGHKCEIFKLGETSIEDIRKVQDPQNTHLLLDSLDEDRLAFGRTKERVLEILDATTRFRKVIVTCRTQFFEVDAEIEQRNAVRIGPYVCPVLYLSPFSDEQVDLYLARRFPPSVWQKLGLGGQGIQTRAKEIAKFMGNLRARPLLLSYIDDIIAGAAVGEVRNEFGLYRVVVSQWLRREERKARDRGDTHVTADRLFIGATVLAAEGQECGAREISLARIQSLSSKLSEVEEVGRIPLEGRSLINRTARGGYRFAHYSFQEYLVACSLSSGANVFRRSPRFHWTGLLAMFFVQALAERGRRADLEGVALSAAPLNGATLAGISLVKALLVEAQLESADLREADLTRANLRTANLQGANLTRTNLSFADLSEANLSKAILVDVEARGIKLAGADALHADLRGAELSDADLSEANLNEGKLGASTRRTTLRCANLSAAHLVRADLSGAQMEGAKLASAVLNQANLAGADLVGADLSHAHLSGANLRNADLAGARLVASNLRNANLVGANLGDADLSDADLTDANLDDANLRGAVFAGTKALGDAPFWNKLTTSQRAAFGRRY